MRVPYVGVTGFMSREETKAAEAVFEGLRLRGDRLLMVGVLASSKTLAGLSNKWPGRYPTLRDIMYNFSSSRRALNLIHYATDDQSTLRDQLNQLRGVGGRDLDGFQLNMAWPDPAQLRGIGDLPRIVLQIGSRALEMADGKPERVVDLIRQYCPPSGAEGRPLITDVLIDASGGHGIPLDLEMAARFIRTIRHGFGNVLGIGVAGGLSDAAVSERSFHDFMAEFPGLNIDAEGALRTPDDRLDLGLVSSYLEAASLLPD